MAHVLHFTEEPLDDIAHSMEVGVMRDRFAGVAFGRNKAQCALFCDLCSAFGAAISLVSDDGDRWLILVQKSVHHLAIVDITA